MAPAEQKNDPAPGCEYTVYTFDQEASGKKRLGRWARKGAYPMAAIALQQAQQLFESQRYQRVEVKQKYFDWRKGRNIDVTLCALEKNRVGMSVKSLAILMVGITCGTVVFFVMRSLGAERLFF